MDAAGVGARDGGGVAADGAGAGLRRSSSLIVMGLASPPIIPEAYRPRPASPARKGDALSWFSLGGNVGSRLDAR